MNWQPIETYDAMPALARPRFSVFYFKEEMVGRSLLRDTVQGERRFGMRTCTHWMPLPEPPKE